MKEITLYLAKLLGVLALFKYLNRKKLFIACYHGVSEKDEHIFKGSVFMSRLLFEKRMAFFKSTNKVLPLDEAVKQLKRGTLPNNSIVITADDGWFSTISAMHPVMVNNDLPYTLYVTTYYVEKQTPVFNIIVDYLFWKTQSRALDLTKCCPALGQKLVDLNNNEEKNNCRKTIQLYGDKIPQEDRLKLLIGLGSELKIDIQKLLDNRTFNLLNKNEIKTLFKDGVDIQLHTHRHKFPKDNAEKARKELIENKEILESITQSKMTHFCYPSGNFVPEYENTLKSAGIISATTCVNGLNNQETNPLFLKRFLDAEDVPQIVLEAEYSGFLDFIRRIIRR